MMCQESNEKLKVNQLQRMLKEYGINTAEELDVALKKGIKDMTLGIMNDQILVTSLRNAHSA